MDYPKVANGDMKPASQEDIERDEHGYTNPNLHRRVDPQEPAEGSGEVAPRDYVIGVYDSTNSTRLTIINTHDEESTTCEIP